MGASDPESKRVIRVLLVDDDETVRQALRRFLAAQRDIEVVGEAASGRQAIEQVERHDPDVVLMDYRMTPMDGLAASREIKRRDGAPRIVLLTMSSESKERSAEVGVDEFLLKACTPESVLDAVRRVDRNLKRMCLGRKEP